ncbi:helix-turn-helix domain-containing protein [Flammeovirga yaeyamensis]|uniref:Helix-turn-helix domain-containing protein n=1 Tax=Flammeovirga yaeyamensis TaxID=367791 RepID=A0AAX1N9U2_9BACT|nr:helix-turn-helix domain-containing protein [Flammeovirga yaeyamensis]MBB3699373.1 AraC-like DNA-binding protein [Flammeovirga yaeyamensis]NMF35367.1 AraC family transcriptional regulator [Flammeovirga yaeyamensis]QWG04227.1 helix-turn-helix domain-containing protein [Flammeovirga yaeyamensis]
MEEKIIIIDTDEVNPKSYYATLEENFGAVIDGNNIYLDNNQYGMLKSFYCEYFPGLICGTTTMKANVPVRIVNRTNKKDKYVSIRIGKSGDFTSESKKSSKNITALYVYNSNQEFYIDYPVNQTIRWYYIRIPVHLIYNFIDTTNEDLLQLVKKEEAWFYFSEITSEFDKIIAELDDQIQDPVVKRGILFSKMIEVLTILQKQSSNNGLDNVVYGVHNDDLNLMFKIRDEILDDYKLIPDLQQLTKKYGMSESKLQRTFKKVFKKPILKFFNHQRLDETRKLVVSTQIDLLEIALDFGYTDLTHFSKRYHQYFGERPSITRKKSGENLLTS